MTTDVETSSEAVSPAIRLIRGLERRYRVVLLSVAVILVVDQVVLQPLLVQLNGLAPAINLAGRQRMLSQRITKAALALQVPGTSTARDTYRSELGQALFDWQRVHHGLREGDADLQLLSAATSEILSALNELEAPFSSICEAAERIAAGEDSQSADLDTVLRMEPEYLTQMDAIVALYESEARRQVIQLRLLAVGAMALVLLLLAGLGRVALRPAIALIRRQMEELIYQGDNLREARDQLEVRVRERTRELSATNSALEREIAERKLAEARSLSLQQQLAHAGRVTSLGQLATGLAHEINQPLAAIANYAEAADLALSRYESDAGIQDCVERIRSAALRAGQIVHRMRNFVRPAEPRYSIVFLRELIADILQMCAFELQRKMVQVTVTFAPSLDDAVSVDPIQIQQVLVNLLQNALQAMAEVKLSQPRLWMSLNREGDELLISVEDNGPGFDRHAVGLLDSTFITTKSDGMGLGLAISRSIVVSHGGRLWTANRESGGACVSFCLPAANLNVDTRESSADCLCRG